MGNPYRKPGSVDRDPEPFNFRGLLWVFGVVLAEALFAAGLVWVASSLLTTPVRCHSETHQEVEYRTVPVWNSPRYDYTQTIPVWIERTVLICDSQPVAVAVTAKRTVADIYGTCTR